MFDILPWYPGPCALQLHQKKLLPDDGHITSFFKTHWLVLLFL